MLVGKPKCIVTKTGEDYSIKLYVPNEVNPEAQVIINLVQGGDIKCAWQKNTDGGEFRFVSPHEGLGLLEPWMPATL